jgi:superfamily I DNA and/or RNA helicase
VRNLQNGKTTRLLQATVVESLVGNDVNSSSIDILIFYQAQVQIHKMLTAPSIHVLTVDSSQGREFDFVIVNTVTPGEK